ncbi:MAG TPA: hypothetical protein VEP50_06775 [bacterium]|nr:hypothetical protein [bacterium]
MKKCVLGVLVLALLGAVMSGSAGAQSAQGNMGTIYVWNLWQNQAGDSVIVYVQLSGFSNPSWRALKYGELGSFLVPAGAHHLKAVDSAHKATIAETNSLVKPGAWFKWCVYGNDVAQAGRCQAWLNSTNPQP